MNDPLYQLFGDRVRVLREEKNVTQEELGRRVDLSRTSITNIEKGRQRVLLHQMVEIASALDAKPQDLMPAEPEKVATPMSDGVARVIEILDAETKTKA
jgi:transcriptional regulator with XRE-family HTH domain